MDSYMDQGSTGEFKKVAVVNLEDVAGEEPVQRNVGC